MEVKYNIRVCDFYSIFNRSTNASVFPGYFVVFVFASFVPFWLYLRTYLHSYVIYALLLLSVPRRHVADDDDESHDGQTDLATRPNKTNCKTSRNIWMDDTAALRSHTVVHSYNNYNNNTRTICIQYFRYININYCNTKTQRNWNPRLFWTLSGEEGETNKREC